MFFRSSQINGRRWFHEAICDILAALKRFDIAATFGWQDVAQRYRRSRLGAFWLTINMGVLITAIALVFGTLFRASMAEFLPYLCVGLVFWSFISVSISEGCLSFISAEGIILQVKMPFFTHILRVIWRNCVILIHNMIIIPVVFIFFGRIEDICVSYFFVGFFVLSINILWIMLILGVVCARYRDLVQIIQNVLQVLFYITPLMWMPHTLPEGLAQQYIKLNPFYHFVAVVRDPLLGQMSSSLTWIVCVGTAVIGWVFTIFFFGKYRSRIPYWM